MAVYDDFDIRYGVLRISKVDSVSSADIVLSHLAVYAYDSSTNTVMFNAGTPIVVHFKDDQRAHECFDAVSQYMTDVMGNRDGYPEQGRG